MADGTGTRIARAVRRADEAATAAAAAGHDAPAARLLGQLADLADQPPLIAAALVTAGAGLAAGRRDLARAGARMLAAHLVATAGKAALKRRVVRTRPHRELAGEPATWTRGERAEHDYNSFPSGHTAGAVAAALALGRELPAARAPAALAAGAVAAAQPVAGRHHLLDVAAGAALGWAADRLVAAAWARAERALARPA